KIGRPGKVEERWQERLVANFAGVHDLRDGLYQDFGRVGGEVGDVPHVRQAAIGRAKIDSDYFLHGRYYSTSISAGARTAVFWLARSGGKSIRSARQPLWRSNPPGAFPLAGTFPSSFTVA